MLCCFNLLGERLGATEHDRLVEVTDGDDVADEQGVTSVGEQLGHELQRGALRAA